MDDLRRRRRLQRLQEARGEGFRRLRVAVGERRRDVELVRLVRVEREHARVGGPSQPQRGLFGGGGGPGSTCAGQGSRGSDSESAPAWAGQAFLTHCYE